MLWLLATACNGTAEIVLLDENNFSFFSNIITDSTVIPEKEDATVDWSGLTKDILENDVDPSSDVGELSLIRFGDLTQAEVIDGINNETLRQSDLTGFVSYEPAGETDALLSEFEINGTFVNLGKDITADGGTYLISLASPDGAYQTFTFFEPTAGAEPATIFIDDDSAQLEYEADVDAGTGIETGRGDRYVLTWSQLTETGADNPIVLSNIDTLMLARYTLDYAELESNFLQLESLAEELYIVDVTGLGSLDLSTVDGFEDFSGDGTWLVALRCGSCVNPSPPFLGLFTP